jgi:hypothetical protein
LEEVVARTLQLFLALAGAWALALWFALAIWTFRDITARTTNPVTHIFSTLMVVLFWVPGAIIYLILRPRETLDEAFQRAMEEEYLLQDLDDFPICPSCRRSVHDDFLFCPHCTVELRRGCQSCSRPIDVRWEACPYCGTSQRAVDEPVIVPVPETTSQREATRRQSAPQKRLQAIDGGRSPLRDQSPEPVELRATTEGDAALLRAGSAEAEATIAPVGRVTARRSRRGDITPVTDRGARDPDSGSRPVGSGS